MWRAALIFGVLSGCAVEPAKHFAANVATVTTSCTRVEKFQLGQLPLEVDVGGKTVRFAEWTLPDERATTVIGFAARLPEGVRFTVESGDRRFTSDQARWVHPDAFTAQNATIDALSFCTTSRVAPMVASR